ncbi:MAG: hypothetical protein HOP17_17245, partial [Acidobacteria bacterium]|nr:hypothetical protein [Acidobacteriota bacterium]
MIKSTGLFAIILLFAGCGGTSDQTAKNAPAATNGKPSVQTQNANTSDQTPVSANVENNKENPLTLSRNKKIEAMRQAGGDPNTAKVDIE